QEQLLAVPSPEPLSTHRRHRETVLLAEDEEAVRALTCEFLQSAGYHVLTASDGAEALEIAGRLAGSIQILVTDVVMPRVRGPDLAERMKAPLPNPRVDLISR